MFSPVGHLNVQTKFHFYWAVYCTWNWKYDPRQGGRRFQLRTTCFRCGSSFVITVFLSRRADRRFKSESSWLAILAFRRHDKKIVICFVDKGHFSYVPIIFIDKLLVYYDRQFCTYVYMCAYECASRIVRCSCWCFASSSYRYIVMKRCIFHAELTVFDRSACLPFFGRLEKGLRLGTRKQNRDGEEFGAILAGMKRSYFDCWVKSLESK